MRKKLNRPRLRFVLIATSIFDAGSAGEKIETKREKVKKMTRPNQQLTSSSLLSSSSSFFFFFILLVRSVFTTDGLYSDYVFHFHQSVKESVNALRSRLEVRHDSSCGRFWSLTCVNFGTQLLVLFIFSWMDKKQLWQRYLMSLCWPLLTPSTDRSIFSCSSQLIVPYEMSNVSLIFM